MTHQEKVSILCEVLFGCFTSVVVRKAFDSRTSIASAFIWTLAWHGQWFTVLQVPDNAKAFIRNSMCITVYPGGSKTKQISLGKLVLISCLKTTSSAAFQRSLVERSLIPDNFTH